MSRRVAPRVAAALLAMALLVTGCSITTSTDQITETAPTSPAGPTTATPQPTDPPPGPTPETTEPAPTATAEPVELSTSEPSDDPADTSPVVIDGGEWVITQNEYDELVSIVEDIHQLDFRDPVGVVVSADIGLEYARGFEPFREPDWLLMRGLGMASTEGERLQANQLRLDRIRGFCCTATADGQAVVVELQSTEFATALIVVHELTHAVHSQHPDLAPRGFDTTETPFPAAAAFEGVPQFVTFEFMKSGSPQDRADVEPDLPIIRDDMLDLIQAGAARHLNFAYDTGPAFVEGVFAARGVEGLSDLMRSPPVTTEQALFPEKYLAGEEAVSVTPPDVPPGARQRGGGTIGSAMLWFLLAEDHGATAARQMVEPWAGDSYVVYELDGNLCLVANIVMDSDGVAVSFAELVEDSIRSASSSADVETLVQTGGRIELQACH